MSVSRLTIPLMAWGTRHRPISNRPRSWELQRLDTTSCSPRLLARPWWRRRGESSFSTHLTERGVTYRGATPGAHRPDFSRHFPCTVDPPVSHTLDVGPPNTACLSDKGWFVDIVPFSRDVKGGLEGRGATSRSPRGFEVWLPAGLAMRCSA